jgi:hypothetical protein
MTATYAKAVCRADRNRRYRRRRRRGRFCITVQIDERILDFLGKAGWLNERDCHDAGKVSEGLTALLELSSKI